MTPLHRLRRRPRPDPRHQLQPRPRLLGRHLGRLLQPRGDPHRAQHGRGALVVDAGAVPLPGGDQRPGARRRHHRHPLGRGPGRGFAEPADQQPPRPVRLPGRDLLLQDRRDQRLQHQTGAQQPEPREAVMGERQQPVPGHERGRVVGGAEQFGRRSSSQSAPGPHAWPRIVSSCRLTRRVPGPTGVRLVRHAAPSGVVRNVGSPVPRRSGPRTRPRSRGPSGTQVRVRGEAGALRGSRGDGIATWPPRTVVRVGRGAKRPATRVPGVRVKSSYEGRASLTAPR